MHARFVIAVGVGRTSVDRPRERCIAGVLFQRGQPTLAGDLDGDVHAEGGARQ